MKRYAGAVTFGPRKRLRLSEAAWPTVSRMTLPTMTSSRFFSPLLLVLGLALLAPTLSGCDAATTDTFDLPPRRVQFTFEFQGGALTPGLLNEVTSNAQVNLIDYVESRGFTSADIVGVRIQNGSAEMEVALPVGAGANSFARAQLRPFQGTNVGTVLLGGSNFGAGSTAPLQIESSAFANVIRTGTFGAQLLVEPNPSVIQSGPYRVRVSFDVLIEVEGA